MNSGLMTVHNNYLGNFIDDTEDFFQYSSWFLSGHKVNTPQPTTTHISTAQLNIGSIYHVFTGITIFNYIRPVKCNVKILNGSKYPAKGFGLVIIKAKKNIIILLGPSYYMPKNPQNTIIQTALKHYNKLRSIIAEALRWLKINKYTGKKLKVETAVNKWINNDWTSLTLMELRLNNNILQIRTS